MDELLKLDNQYCFPIYVAAKEVIKLYKPALDKFNLTYTQYITLLVLWEKDNILVKDLGDKLYLESNTLTPLLQKLEKKELISRVKDENDKRKVYIRLTEKGYKLKDSAKEIPQELMCKISYNNEKFKQLTILLKELITDITEQN
ncbi:MAG: MarR family transcriptional regulator [Sphaerochaetaceae bacterium]|nr:MarR family transcriptional regulator [Sphaerochaetaceae bacterium]